MEEKRWLQEAVVVCIILYHFVSFCILDFGSADLLATRNDTSLDSLGIKKNTLSQETSWSTVEPINNEHVSAIRLL